MYVKLRFEAAHIVHFYWNYFYCDVTRVSGSCHQVAGSTLCGINGSHRPLFHMRCFLLNTAAFAEAWMTGGFTTGILDEFGTSKVKWQKRKGNGASCPPI